MDRVEVPVGGMAAFDSYAMECPDFQERNELLRKVKNCKDLGMFQDCATPITSDRRGELWGWGLFNSRDLTSR